MRTTDSWRLTAYGATAGIDPADRHNWSTPIVIDPLYPHQLYVGTDVGAFYTTNTGATWMTMGSGLPNSSINDMQIHSGSRIARAFTHGRSLWELNLDELVITAVPPDAQPHETFSISNNYPNPFNPSTTLEVSLSTQSDLTVMIYDLQGKVVRVLTYRQLGAGTHAVAWDGKTDTGVPIASGIYLCQARVGSEVQTRRIVLLR